MDLAATSSAVPLVGALLTLLGRMALGRRSQRAAALGPARLVGYELQTAIHLLEHALETGRWWHTTLRPPTWQQEKSTLASALTDDELNDLHHGMDWLEFADRIARKRQRGLGRLRPRLMTAQDREHLEIVLQMARQANQALLPLTRRKHNARRRSRRSRPQPTPPSLRTTLNHPRT